MRLGYLVCVSAERTFIFSKISLVIEYETCLCCAWCDAHTFVPTIVMNECVEPLLKHYDSKMTE